MIKQNLLTERQKQLIYSKRDLFKTKSTLIDLFTATELPILDIKISDAEYNKFRNNGSLKVKKVNDGDIYIINSNAENKPSLVAHAISHDMVAYIQDYKGKTSPLFDITDQILVKPNEIINLHNTTPMKISVGRIVVNQVILIEPFNDEIDMVDDPYDIGAIEEIIAIKLVEGKLKVEQYQRYMDLGFYILHFSELNVPSFTAKSTVTHPDIKKLKEELFNKYKGQLEDPVIAAKVEDALIKLDKEWLGDDPSTGFYNAIGFKAYNIARKKMYLLIGGIENFSKEINSYSFLQHSLEDGFDIKSTPIICNEIRKGSYDRSTSVRDAGAMSNSILRVFQDSEIVENDCGVNTGVKFTLTQELLKQFIGRYLLVGIKKILLTDNNIREYVGKFITMRSPLYCKSKNGFCETCCGKLYTNLNITNLNMNIIEVTSTLLTLKLKGMHGTALSFDKVNYENYFV